MLVITRGYHFAVLHGAAFGEASTVELGEVATAQ